MTTKTVYSNRTVIEEPRLDMSLFKKKGNSSTIKGYMLQKMKEARREKNFEVAVLIQHFYKKCCEFESSEEVRLESWKGKSSFEIIAKPDKFIVITFQKPTQDEEPKKIKREILKEEVNKVLWAISELNKNKKIPTRDIGELVYKKEWDRIFSNRQLHTELNLILRLLDKYGVIHYRGGFSQVLKNVIEIQEVLK